jgi:hypothetical protein
MVEVEEVLHQLQVHLVLLEVLVEPLVEVEEEVALVQVQQALVVPVASVVEVK